jgi:biopolymer transport protein ExbB
MLDVLNPAVALNGLQEFLETGGPVLSVIMIATFILWAFIVERLFYWYGPGGFSSDRRRALKLWESRSHHGSVQSGWVRDQLVSEVRQNAERNVEIVKVVVAIAPLLGLLGTVTGMIEVFDVMASSGSSSARAMSEGVSRATIPTMAGMVTALSGLFFTYRLDRDAKTRVQRLADELERE